MKRTMKTITTTRIITMMMMIDLIYFFFEKSVLQTILKYKEKKKDN